MSKNNYLLTILILLSVAFLFGMPGDVYSKAAPPVGLKGKTTGPSTSGTMTFFFKDSDPAFPMVTFDGHCQNMEIKGTVDYDWAKKTTPALAETDLVQHGQECTGTDCPFEQLFRVPGSDIEVQLQGCYGLTTEVVIMQFKNVSKFTEVLLNQVYTAEVGLVRVIE